MSRWAFGCLASADDKYATQNAYYMSRALRQVCGDNSIVIDRLRASGITKARSAAPKVARKLLRLPEFPAYATKAAFRSYARNINRAVTASDVSHLLVNQAFLAAEVSSGPTVIVHVDATARGLADLGGYFDGWAASAIRDLQEREELGLRRANLVVVTSDWARAAVVASGVPASRVADMPIAANIDDSTWPLPPESAVDDYTQDLVFFGTSWHRKGGDFLLQVTRELDARGHPGRLLVVGPPASEVMQRATNYGIAHKVRPLGPLDKSSTESLRRVRDAVRRAALHLLPTVADCSPVSIPELAALAIPTIGRAVGGVAYTCEAAGGLSLNPAATVTDWCDAVTRLTDSPMELSRRRGQSLAQYWRGLRWSRVIERIVRLE